MVVDIHTHAYPEKIAEKARENLQTSFKVRLGVEPTVASLLARMDANGVDVSVVNAVATRPDQVRAINDWVFSIRSTRIRVFASLHPDYKDWEEELDRIVKSADGIKFQPEFQDFFVDEKRVFPIYERIEQLGLPVLFHCGFELSGTHVVHASPARIALVHRCFPALKLIAGHFGGFQMWDEVKKHLLGQELWFDTAFFFRFLPRQEVINMLNTHPREKILFGTDFPLVDQEADLRFLRELDIDGDLKDDILGGNARRLLKRL